ncbi:N-acetylmuramoyl-L-alanine amidase [Thalassotalea sp. G20_0]|uniref:N-acetylmuramoyl-L-alanine amidase n=1 Tax=Thalassotalea sp. G20_0 TaxID=2821093 RepID=UPI001ADBE054|nr:N-acetylmuramoyl-L-alanine amidase [Thalassotalea sp. G20_0]MBO9496765.1 N-acetylmuramoyl-L-alanine amidase [Thalassotalea sp. G20_0]
MSQRTGIVRRVLARLWIKQRAATPTRKRAASGTEVEPVFSGGRRRFVRQLGILAVGLAALKVQVAEAVYKLIKNVRLWRSPDKTRLVFDVSDAVEHNKFHLSNPDRLVIDVDGARLSGSFSGLQLKNTPIQKIRHGARNKNDLRIVLDLSEKVSSESFLLKPNATYGHRLVVDLFDDKSRKPQPVVRQKPTGHRDIVVAIDAGHGGEDPGAIAYGGGYEKQVTLAIAKELATLLGKEKGFRPVLVRTGDYYIDLRRRTQIARDNKADLFISIHADGFKDRRAKGASVYALSRRGATSETARWLAQKENASDQIGGEGGISLGDKDDVLAGVLLDLSMTSTLSSSLEVGNKVLANMGGINQLHKKQVEQAGFVVLKSPDIPSILIETGFITNPEEARKLKSRSHQKAMAKAIFNGTKSWFYKKPPPDTLVAKWKQEGTLNTRPSRYVIKPGDTLSEIANRFEISMNDLKRANRLSSTNTIRVGQVLQIPD